MQKHALLPIACALALTACADGHDMLAHSDHDHAENADHGHNDHGHDHGHGENGATIKPGANIGISHQFVENPIVGGAQIVRLTINEPYESGELEIEVVKNEGIRVLQTTRTVINLAAGNSHTWDVQFEAPAEGRFYIGLLATIKDGSNSNSYRAYSVPVYVGDVSDFKREAEGFGLDETPQGQPIVIMEARETISEKPPADDGGN